MYLLDTNHCSLAMNHQPDIMARLAELYQSQICTCVIVQAELIYMAENSRQRDNNLNRVIEFLQNILIYEIDSKTAEIYGSFQADLMNNFGPKEKNKRRKTRLIDIGVSQHDLWIASIAGQHNLILVSADSDFQRIQTVRDLTVESWYRPTN
ncbi:type II toxin-antitoxin system VapC family toxin [Limnospira fusiformis KN01]|uniref:PilT protein domain protein n=3 Tax=Limnospira TaxID=2596745 RepID=B5VZ64_LIMMA|nr:MULTISPECIES: type II toxin-antitoxin system VapC family toxin [Limnospira]EKD10140.1 PilT protein domain protein [Arthrospira platensis C1]MDC0839092.1 type II toxin-antitoxin system VapC family toxin [Limnoraphis robusta]MDY7052049.1 type II toxin-antitoxin system VapC family toxin [Limnospira fusiformis LS22]EDZ95536.1 PilT protein domain protein [Limnospira maxima CS-328]MDT9186497.1 type II toxin-antitoxin system VapC family toxin [Limnospira sp. PMC 894.15]